jgi:hypothetical protein
MWARVKGETELALQGFGLAGIVCWRPGYIHPIAPRKDPGFGERVIGALYPMVKGLEGMSVEADDIGYAMIEAELEHRRSGILENKEIRALARKYKGKASTAGA